LALRNTVLEDSSLRGRKLADDERILCASPHYLALHGTPEHPADLADHQLIAFRKPSIHELIAKNGDTGKFNPRESGSRLTLDDGLSQKLVTLSGAGISINSRWCVHPEIADGSLIRVLKDYVVNDESALWLVYPKTNVLTAKVRIFIDFLLEKLGDA